MPQKKKRKPHSSTQTMDNFIQADTMYRLVQSIRSGKTAQQMAHEFNLPVEEIRILIKDATMELTERYMEFATIHRSINHARLEYLYTIAEPMADGTFLAALENESKMQKGELPNAIPVPDRHWIKAALDIIKAQNDMTTPDSNRIREAADRTEQQNYDVPQASTLSSGDDIFWEAQQRMEETWLTAPHIMADYDQRDLIDAIREGEVEFPEGTGEYAPDVKALNKRIDKLNKAIGIEDDAEETDESE